MDSDLYLVLYRISGWTVNLFTFYLSYAAIRNKQMWAKPYLYLAIFLCGISVLELISSITAVVLTNNLFMGYTYAMVYFIFTLLYLSNWFPVLVAKKILLILIPAFIAIQCYSLFTHHLQYDAIGEYVKSSVLILSGLYTSTILFIKNRITRTLHSNPNFWFMTSILSISFLGLTINTLADSSYASESETVLFILLISDNFLKAILMYGYYRGINLLR